MDPSLRYDFDRDFRSKNWYKTSLSLILDKYVTSYKSELDEIPYSILHDAAIAIFCHESRINIWIQGVDISKKPFHQDLGFVRGGYKEALETLLVFFDGLTEDRTPSHPKAIYIISQSLVPLLKEKLEVLNLEYDDRVWYYSQAQNLDAQ